MTSNGTNYDHENIGEGVYALSALSCQKSCQRLKDCDFWSWTTDTGICYRKYKKTTFRYDEKSISGPRYCGVLYLNSKLWNIC